MDLFNWANDDAEAQMSPILPPNDTAAQIEAMEQALAALHATFLLWECGYTHEAPEPRR